MCKVISDFVLESNFNFNFNFNVEVEVGLHKKIRNLMRKLR